MLVETYVSRTPSQELVQVVKIFPQTWSLYPALGPTQYSHWNK